MSAWLQNFHRASSFANDVVDELRCVANAFLTTGQSDTGYKLSDIAEQLHRAIKQMEEANRDGIYERGDEATQEMGRTFKAFISALEET